MIKKGTYLIPAQSHVAQALSVDSNAIIGVLAGRLE